MKKYVQDRRPDNQNDLRGENGHEGMAQQLRAFVKGIRSALARQRPCQPYGKARDQTHKEDDQGHDSDRIAHGKGGRVAGHTKDALGRKHHGYRPHLIPFDVTPPAGSLIISAYHMMDPGGLSPLTPPLPNNSPGCLISNGLNAFQVAGATSNHQVGISRHLFVMREMALPTIPQFLGRMPELGRILVAGATAQVCMGRFLILGLIY